MRLRDNYSAMFYKEIFIKAWDEYWLAIPAFFIVWIVALLILPVTTIWVYED